MIVILTYLWLVLDIAAAVKLSVYLLAGTLVVEAITEHSYWATGKWTNSNSAAFSVVRHCFFMTATYLIRRQLHYVWYPHCERDTSKSYE